MSKGIILRISDLRKSVERFTEEEIAEKVMEGSERITISTKPEKVANWVKGVIDRLDSLVDEDTRCQIMRDRGYNCALAGNNITKTRAIRNKYNTEDEYIEGLQREPPRGTRLIRQGNVVYLYYTPQNFGNPPIRCYCSLARKLPQGKTISRTYCECSRAFAEKSWESILGRSVEVELLESSVTGSQECKFAIHLY
jgi:hypothetical protein